MCRGIESAVLAYVRSSCFLYLGWRDSCTGCTLAPTKWGSTTTAACASGVGGGNTCTTQPLGGEMVELLGLDLDGEANDDDKFYIGAVVRRGPCDLDGDRSVPSGAVRRGDERRRLGRLRVARRRRRDVLQGPLRRVSRLDRQLYRVLHLPDQVGAGPGRVLRERVGVNDTCTTANLGGATVSLFGLSTGGDVNDDDKFDMGFSCN